MFDLGLGRRRSCARAGSLVLALVVAASAPLLVDCSGTDDPAGNNPDGGGPAASPPSPLRFTYDEATKRVRVRVTDKVDDQMSVVMRLRKGTLTYSGLDELDCDALAKSGVRVSMKGAMADGSVTGPQVDDALLDQFYIRETIGPDATEAQLAAIRAGTDPIVEGCLVRDGKTLAKQQMSLFRAWDDATPDLLDRIQAVESGGPADARAAIHSVGTYGALCERELGEIPFFRKADGSYTTYDCTKGSGTVTIPITVTDGSGKAVEQMTEPEKCDKPDWLRRSCQPFARVQHAVNSKGTDWVLICRKMLPGQKRDDTTFNDQGLIGHNPKTGKTCYFQNGLYGKSDGAHVASPGDPKIAESTWSLFDVSTFHSCHDNDAFAHSPWIDQAKKPDGSFVVPRIGSHPSYPMNNAAPFVLVAMRSQNWAMRDQLVSPEARACTTCHRITAGNTITGEQTGASWTERSVGLDDFFQNTRVSPGFQAFANTHWMPPTLNGLTESTWRNSDFGKAVTFIRGCKTNAKNCKWEPIPTK